jgi:hypothetical protein
MQFELDAPDEETQRVLQSQPPPADAKYVRFYRRTKENRAKSMEAGRPIYEPVEYVEILTPGDKDVVVDRPVRKIDRYQWSDKYRAFAAGKSQDTVGTPLTALMGMSPERAEELAYFKIRTVETLADVSDNNLQNLGHGALTERQRARDYVQVMKGNAPVAQLRSENEQLRQRLEALEKLMTEAAPAKAEAAKAKKS